MRVFSILVVLCLGAVLSFGAGLKIGDQAASMTLTDPSGAETTVPLKGGITVVAWVATQCPVSNAYNERMSAVYKDYSAKGVRFVFVNANRTESAAEVNAHAEKHFPFKVYKDEGNVQADRFGATVTPEFHVFDKDGVLRYHGSLDDAQNLANVTEHRLRNALDALIEGKAVEKPETKAFGCTIKRVPKAS